jgi:hypothetical protein
LDERPSAAPIRRRSLRDRLIMRGDPAERLEHPEPTREQLIERRPNMLRRLFRNRILTIALAAASLGAALALRYPADPGASPVPPKEDMMQRMTLV